MCHNLRTNYRDILAENPSIELSIKKIEDDIKELEENLRRLFLEKIREKTKGCIWMYCRTTSVEMKDSGYSFRKRYETFYDPLIIYESFDACFFGKDSANVGPKEWDETDLCFRYGDHAYKAYGKTLI